MDMKLISDFPPFENIGTLYRTCPSSVFVKNMNMEKEIAMMEKEILIDFNPHNNYF